VANIRRSRRSGFVTRGGRQVRESLWFAIASTDTQLASANTAALFTGLTATLLALRPFTVVRTRGYIHVRSDQITTSEIFQGSMGAAVVSDQALAIGVTAVPTPETDKGSDLWFVFETLAGAMSVSSAIGIWEQQIGREFDSRAMRKVEEGEDIAFSVESSAISAGLQWMKSGRMLIKLH